MTTRTVETIIVGAGQAGLVASRLLDERGREHVLLDRRQVLGGGWLDRWDEFCLVSPNWTLGVPGLPYDGPDPDGFLPRDGIVAHWRRYAATIAAPVELETEVSRLRPIDDGGVSRFELETSSGRMLARTVIVAGGPFQVPHVPAVAAGLDKGILSLHSHHYRSVADLPPGGVLLVGSGQTGVQLAEELVAAGRAVTLAVGSCGRAPRRYRDRDIFWWLRELGTTGRDLGTGLPTAEQLPSPAARFSCNPHLSGHGGGHDTNLRRMAAEGIRLTGRLESLDGTRAFFRADLGEKLRSADRFFDERLRGACDTYVARAGLDLPADEPAQFAFEPPEVEQLDLAREGISTVLWTSGYRPSLGWIEADVFDSFGLPVQQAGVTDVPGLAFLGTPWLLDMGSANLVGLVRDAETLVDRLEATP
jgi:putative flavoprotein involved in K+ transport